MNKGFKPAKRKPLPKIYVVPIVLGSGPRDPHTKIKLPGEGDWVPDNQFWNRRLIQKDVERADPPEAEAPPEPTAEVSPEPKKTPKPPASSSVKE